VALGTVASSQFAAACPFCGQVQQTFTQEIGGADAAVIARLVESPPKATGLGLGDSLAKSKFEIVEVLRGEKLLAGRKRFEAICFGDYAAGATFLVTATDPADLNWATPNLMNDRGCKYLQAAVKLPAEGPERLVFFQDYLEDQNETLARDAFDEFAKASYTEVKQLKEQMQRDKLRVWIASPDVTPSRRRLYLMMLGVCGEPEDLSMLESLINSPDRQKRMGLDAIVGAYLTLKGPEGVTLIEDKFLKNKDADYIDTLAAIMALRILGQEEHIIPKDRLLAALRTMLDRPQLADTVIPDLARWEDWSVVERLFELFVAADPESSWIRVPVIKFFQACPLPAAKAHLEECAKLDQQAFRQAKSFMMPGAGGPSKSLRKAAPVDTKAPAASTPSKEAKTAPTSGDATKTGGDAKTSSEADSSLPAAPSKKTSQATPSAATPLAGTVAPANAEVADVSDPAASDPPADEPGTRETGTGESARASNSRSTDEKPVEPGTAVAAIGVTPLAAAAIADPAVHPFSAWQVGGVFSLAGAALLSAMWWLLATG
jgi:hypothetical protein